MSEQNRISAHEVDGNRDTIDDPSLLLIGRAQAGEQAAFTSLYALHEGRITVFVAQRLQGCADVPEVIQDVFFKAFRSIGTFRGGSKFSTWLY